VTTAEIAEAIKSLSNVEVDKRDISIPDVDQLGTYSAEVKLHPEVIVTVEFNVVAE
jgi:large subunit ribosomal protein L9